MEHHEPERSPLRNRGLGAPVEKIHYPFPPAHPAVQDAARGAHPAHGRAYLGRQRLLTTGLMTGLAAGVAAGGGLALVGASPVARSVFTPQVTSCGESVQDVINTALAVERLAITFYYTGLTTPAVARASHVAGRGAGLHRAPVPHPGGHGDVARLRAVLEQEQRHDQLLRDLGATSPYTRFYFPASTFKTRGYTSHAGTFLWVLDHLETAVVGTYLAAVKRLGALGHSDLAILAARLLGTECEHRALGRVIAGDDPVDNVTLEVNSFDCVRDAAANLTPYVTGKGFASGATRAIPVPSAANIARVVGPRSGS